MLSWEQSPDEWRRAAEPRDGWKQGCWPKFKANIGRRIATLPRNGDFDDRTVGINVSEAERKGTGEIRCSPSNPYRVVVGILKGPIGISRSESACLIILLVLKRSSTEAALHFKNETAPKGAANSPDASFSSSSRATSRAPLRLGKFKTGQ
jgi:hypothetical protein